jgi:serine/threonine protein kinase
MPDEITFTELGRRLGRYSLLYRLASGGMADLYLARLEGEEGFKRIVAIKVIHSHLSQQEQFVKMFIDEARLASRISHPNVALTLDLGRVESKHFIAMEYVDGESLSAVLRRVRPPLHYAARIVSDAAAGLHAAHDLCGEDGELLGVVHRDVSPQNLMISYDGAVKVVDFGVARARGSLHTTSEGELKGKFGYMSPEQFSDPQGVDRRTDVFALGIILYETTTWRRLFKAENEAATVNRVLNGKIELPTGLIASYPEELERIVMRALDRDPDSRYQTAQELHDDLERFVLSVGESASSSTIAKMMRKVFADRIRDKKAVLATCRVTPGSEPLADVELSSGTSVDMHSSIATYHPSRRWIGFVIGLVLVAAAAFGVATLLLKSPRQHPAAAHPKVRPVDAAPPAQHAADPRVVTIGASATPANATLKLAGKKMSNPFEVTRPAGEGIAELVASAAGYKTQRFEVSLVKGGNWSVGLLPEEMAQDQPKQQTRERRGTKKHGTKKHGTKKHGTKKRGSRYLNNPY